MAAVSLRNVGKRFGAVQAVAELNLEVRDHEFISFLGPSGCGKTTTLNMIAGLETPSSGEIRIGEADVTRMPAMQRDVAMVFQSYALYPHMTVEDNLGFALRVRGFEKAVIKRRVAEAADVLALSELLARFPRQLSGGQRQRVALGRALVRDPKVFLLDEPLSNLDAVLRVQTRAELKRLFNRLQTTAIYVTHDQAEAMTMSDRIAVFHRGRLQQIGTPLQIYRAPVNRFVASFVGSPPMTFIDAVVSSDGRLTFAGMSLAGPRALPRAESGRPLALGLRPEDVRIGPEGVPAKVELVEHLGSASIVYLRLGEVAVVAQQAETEMFRVGDDVKVAIDPDACYLFATDHGEAVVTPGASGPSPEPRSQL